MFITQRMKPIPSKVRERHPQGPAGYPLERNTVAKGLTGDSVEPLHLRRAIGHNPLAGFAVVDATGLTVLIQHPTTTNTQPGLEGVLGIVDPSMDNLTIAGRHPFAKVSAGFQHQHLPALLGQRPGHCEADNAGTDDHGICLYYVSPCHLL